MEFRTIDGSGNNLDRPELNAPGTAFARIGPARFADGVLDAAALTLRSLSLVTSPRAPHRRPGRSPA